MRSQKSAKAPIRARAPYSHDRSPVWRVGGACWCGRAPFPRCRNWCLARVFPKCRSTSLLSQRSRKVLSLSELYTTFRERCGKARVYIRRDDAIAEYAGDALQGAGTRGRDRLARRPGSTLPVAVPTVSAERARLDEANRSSLRVEVPRFEPPRMSSDRMMTVVITRPSAFSV
jgi:hypothetical protein